MILPGGARTGDLLNANVSASGVTPAGYAGGVPFDADRKICIATGVVSVNDRYVNGFRIAPSGSIRGSVSGGTGTRFVNGYWFTDDGRLRISDGVSAASHFSNGDAFVASGRLALSYP